MKTRYFIIPVAACLVAGIGIGSQRRTMGHLQQEAEFLEKRISLARSTGTADEGARERSKSGKPGRTKSSPINWAETAASILELRIGLDGAGGIRKRLKLQSLLASMSKEELVSALDEIATLNLPASDRRHVEIALFDPLAKLDPEMALTRFIGLNDDRSGSFAWQMGDALSRWMGKDQNAAIAWVDQQTEAGSFESKSLDESSRLRTQFETDIFKKLILSDPLIAQQRLAGIPQAMRKMALMNFQTEGAGPETQQAYASIVRAQVSEKQQAMILMTSVGSLVDQEGFQKVDQYLDTIDASPAERNAAVEKVLQSKSGMIMQDRKISREDVDRMREWALKNSSGSVDGITGEVIANSLEPGRNNTLTYSEAADLVDQYHDEDGGDEILIGFLESGSPGQDMDRARILAGKITDEKRREEILKRYK